MGMRIMNIIEKLISVNFTGRGGKPITRITLHTQVSGARDLFSWFNRSSTQASSNYSVNNFGEVYRYVSEDKASWANSNLDSNSRSISIETWDNGNPNDYVRTGELYLGCAELVADLCKRYSIPCQLVSQSDAKNWAVKGIDLHRYFNPNKTCPAGLDSARIIREANLILNENTMFDFEIILTGKDTKIKVISGNVDENATIKNLTKGTSWQSRIIGGVGHISTAVNSDTEQCLYEVTLKGVTRQLDNRPTIDKDAIIKDLNAQIINITAERDGYIEKMGKLNTLKEENGKKYQATIKELNQLVDDTKTKLETANRQITTLQEANKNQADRITQLEGSQSGNELAQRIADFIKKIFGKS